MTEPFKPEQYDVNLDGPPSPGGTESPSPQSPVMDDVPVSSPTIEEVVILDGEYVTTDISSVCRCYNHYIPRRFHSYIMVFVIFRNK